jgi:hypothetical protein
LQWLFSAFFHPPADSRWKGSRRFGGVYNINKLHAGRKLALRGKIRMHTYTHIFRKCAIAKLAMAAMTMSPLAAQVDLGLSPMRVEFPAVAGKSVSGTLVLSNAADVNTRIRAELLDLYVDETTTPQFVAHAPGEAEYSCRSWLSANPMELEVEPHSQALIRYSVRVPAGATERSYHCAVGFRTIPLAADTNGTTMRTAVRMITVFYPIVGKPKIAGVIKELKLERVTNQSGTVWRAVVVMENSGVMLYRPAGEVDILDRNGRVIESQKLVSFPALPQRQQRYVLALNTNLRPDRYTLRARIEVGGEIQEATVAVTAEAPPAVDTAVIAAAPK